MPSEPSDISNLSPWEQGPIIVDVIGLTTDPQILEQIYEISSHPGFDSSDISCALAKNIYTPEHILTELARRSIEMLHTYLSENINLPLEAAKIMYQANLTYWVRSTLRNHPKVRGGIREWVKQR